MREKASGTRNEQSFARPSRKLLMKATVIGQKSEKPVLNLASERKKSSSE